MGGRDPRKLVSFRATDDEVAAIECLVKASGLSKQEYLLRSVLGVRSHTHALEADSSIKVLSDNALGLIAKADSSHKFKNGQEITAQSAKTYDQLWLGEYQKLGKVEYLLSNELNLLCKVKAGKASRAGRKKLEVLHYFPDDEIVLFDDGNFLREKGAGSEWFTKRELEAIELEATRAALKVTNEEMPIEVVEQLSTPINEVVVRTERLNLEVPQTLTKQKFRKQFGFVGQDTNEAYGKACIKGRAKGWTAPDGGRWFTSSHSKNGEWSTDKSAVIAAQVALA